MAMPFIFGNHQCPFSTLRVVSKHVDPTLSAAKPREIFVQIKEEQRSDLSDRDCAMTQSWTKRSAGLDIIRSAE
jgi:hypothetical protein